MKVQKLGLVLGINMAAACLMMQGCKATKPGRTATRTTPPSNRTITVVSRPAVQPAVTPAAEPAEVPEQKIAVDQPQPVEQKPSAVTTVKTLPPAPKKPATAVEPKKVAAAPAETAATEEYVVKPGDTLFLISKRTNYRMGAILAVNPGLNADRVRVGQKIKLPGAAPAATVAAAPAPQSAEKQPDAKVMPAAAPAPAAANTKAPVKTKIAFATYDGPTKEYVVKSGDSLGKIAIESGISIRALKAMNGLTKDNLRIGQKLQIPAEKQIAAAKDVKKVAAAKKPDAAADKTKVAAAAKPADDKTKEAAAPVEPTKADETKKLDDAAQPAVEAVPPAADAAQPAADAAKPVDAEKPAENAPAPATAGAEAPAATGPTHIVKEDEDLVSIAIAYAISPSVLMDLNDIKLTEQDKVKPGTVLKLPANAKPVAAEKK